jgi:hypothetical protein
MKKELTLKKPLLVEGKEVTKLFYDFDLFDETMLNRAEKIENERSQGMHSIIENNYGYHMIIAKLAIEAATPGVSFEDLSRIKGFDLFTITKAGRDFLYELDTAPASSSGAVSEPIAEPTAETKEPCETGLFSTQSET